MQRNSGENSDFEGLSRPTTDFARRTYKMEYNCQNGGEKGAGTERKYQ